MTPEYIKFRDTIFPYVDRDERPSSLHFNTSRALCTITLNIIEKDVRFAGDYDRVVYACGKEEFDLITQDMPSYDADQDYVSRRVVEQLYQDYLKSLYVG